MSIHLGPADERSNRIVGGTFATPNTTYTQSSLPYNLLTLTTTTFTTRTSTSNAYPPSAFIPKTR